MNVFFLEREIGERMIARLEMVTLKPEKILSLGNDEGFWVRQRYPKAQVFLEMDLPAHSLDLIFANYWLPWHDLSSNLLKWREMLRPEGLLMFTHFGPDTLKELSSPILAHRMDMHDVGDALTQTGWMDPVLDVEYVTATYKDSEKLVKELHEAHFIDEKIQPEKNKEGKYQTTYEIVYGHAWGPGLSSGYSADESGVVRVPLSQLRGRR